MTQRVSCGSAGPAEPQGRARLVVTPSPRSRPPSSGSSRSERPAGAQPCVSRGRRVRAGPAEPQPSEASGVQGLSEPGAKAGGPGTTRQRRAQGCGAGGAPGSQHVTIDRLVLRLKAPGAASGRREGGQHQPSLPGSRRQDRLGDPVGDMPRSPPERPSCDLRRARLCVWPSGADGGAGACPVRPTPQR